MNKIEIAYLEKDFSIREFADRSWEKAENIVVDKYWSGAEAPNGRHFTAKLLWSKTALYVRFEANQSEPLIISDVPNLTNKTKGLWERDVCEIFVAPNKEDFRRYYEFEVSPLGEWIDLGVYQAPGKRETDWDYHSGMQPAAKIEKGRVWMAIKIEWQAFNKIPSAGDVWMGNIFRCVGQGATRGYLAWQPTCTDEPAFHIPEKFGQFEFGE